MIQNKDHKLKLNKGGGHRPKKTTQQHIHKLQKGHLQKCEDKQSTKNKTEVTSVATASNYVRQNIVVKIYLSLKSYIALIEYYVSNSKVILYTNIYDQIISFWTVQSAFFIVVVSFILT